MTGQPPDLVPVLARGHHRKPSKGACFMELASYLAGERWSDHPECTHRLLSSLARSVNDCTSDAGRPRLAVLIPSVIGLTGDDVRIDATIAMRAATTALPVAAADRQRVMAVAILTADRLLGELDGRRPGELADTTREVLDQAPEAERWARHLTRDIGVSARGYRRHAAPSAVRCAVLAVAEACVPEPDALLHDMLAGAIGDLQRISSTAPVEIGFATWRDVCRLTGVT